MKTIEGNTYLVEKNEALRVWIYKALYTQRYKYLAYSSVFGNEIETLIGKVNTKVLDSEMKRFIIESIMVNPYIEELSEFKFFQYSSYYDIEFTAKTVYGIIIFNMQYKGGIK